MKRPRFSIIHPTARVKGYPPSLPRGWQHTCEELLATCLDPDSCEYILVVHESRWREFLDGPLGNPREFLRKLWKHYRIICNQARDCNVDQVNRGALEATGEILIGTMDDLFPCPEWDRLIYEAFPDLTVPAIVHIGTGSPRDKELIVGGACTKAYYDTVGYIHPPEFDGMYADDWMSRKWRADGFVIERLDIQFEHRHPAFGTAAIDPIYELQNRPEAYEDGRKEFLRRVAEEQPERSASLWKVVACLLPGEQFSHDYLVAWTNLYGHLLRSFEVHPHFCHTSNVYVTRLELAQSVLEVEPHADVILTIDDDNIVSVEHVKMLMQTLAEHPEADAVCGWCWIYNHNSDAWLVSCGRTPKDESMMYTPLSYQEALSGALFEVQASGFPVVLMRYSMLEKLGARAFSPIVDPKLLYGFSSEDAAFWKRAMDAGCKLYCDTRVRVEHMKTRAIQPVFVSQKQLAQAAD
ncbi:MAG: glycosyltransferase family A protein [Chthoniobacteraceae bacterium]|nr:glycosyltransferase family A protein [Chthoniobacteraceae bacterium]